MVWVTPTVTALDVSHAAAEPASGKPNPCDQLEIIVKICKRVSVRYGGKTYTTGPVGTKVGLRYDVASGDWLKTQTTKTCIPRSQSYGYDTAVHLDFVTNLKPTAGVPQGQKVPLLVKLPDHYIFVAGWSKRGQSCAVAAKASAYIVFA